MSEPMLILGPNGQEAVLPSGEITRDEYAMLQAWTRFKEKYHLVSNLYCDHCNVSEEARVAPTYFVWKCSCRALRYGCP